MPRLSISMLALLCVLCPALVCWGQNSPAPLTPQDAVEVEYELMVRYARVKRDLADVELEQALELKDALPQFNVERLRSNLSVAEEQLRQTSLATTGGAELVHMRHALEQVRLANIEFEAAQKLHDKKMIGSLELRRLELKLHLAKLKVELLKNPATVMTLMDSLENRLDRFGEEILLLEHRISRLEAAAAGR